MPSEPQQLALGDSKLRMACLVLLALAPALVAAMVITVPTPILPLIADHFKDHGGTLLAQYIFGISGIGVVVGAVAGGHGVDRFGCRWVMILSLIVYAISGVIVPFLDEAREVLAARFLVGCASGAFYAAATALVGQVWTGTTRSRLLGYVTAVAAAIAIPTMIASGKIADAFGWSAPFFLYALVLPFILPCFAVPVAVRRKETAVVRATWAEWQSLLPIYVRALPIYIVAYLPFTQFPLLLAEDGMPTSERAVLLGLPSIFAGITAFLFATINRHLGRFWVFLGVLGAYGAGTLALGLGAQAAYLAILLFGIGAGLIHPHFKHEVLAIAPTRIQGKASGMIVSIHYVAHFFNPVVIGSVAVALGLRHTMIVTGGVLLVWLAVVFVRGFSNRTALAKEV